MFLQTDAFTWLNFDRVQALTVVPHRDRPGKFVTLAHLSDGRTWVVATSDDRHSALIEAEEILQDAGVLLETP